MRHRAPKVRRERGKIAGKIVLTLESTNRLSDLDKDLLRERLIAYFASWEAGDIDSMLAFADHDIVCYPTSTWRHASYRRPIVGKEAMREAFRQREINYVQLSSKLHRILVDGEQAAVHRTTTIRERGGGDTFTFDCINFFRFRDGLIVEFQEFPDGSAYEAVINFPH
jgi:ketosteroid isomerase-like protein